MSLRSHQDSNSFRFPSRTGLVFTKNAEAFKAKLTALEAKEARIKKEHAGEGIAITEPVPLYLTTASGLVNRTPEAFSEAIEEGDDVSPRILQATLAVF